MSRTGLTWDTVVTQSREPVAVEVDRSVVMMSMAREKYYSLGGAGGRIWELLEEPVTVRELCERLTAEFEVEAGECRQDVEAFLSGLLKEGLVEVRGESSDPVRTTSDT